VNNEGGTPDFQEKTTLFTPSELAGGSGDSPHRIKTLPHAAEESKKNKQSTAAFS
jgi:hypothetical protein